MKDLHSKSLKDTLASEDSIIPSTKIKSWKSKPVSLHSELKYSEPERIINRWGERDCLLNQTSTRCQLQCKTADYMIHWPYSFFCLSGFVLNKVAAELLMEALDWHLTIQCHICRLLFQFTLTLNCLKALLACDPDHFHLSHTHVMNSSHRFNFDYRRNR